MLHDPLADALTNLKNYELTGKNDCMLKPASKLLKNILDQMHKLGYVGKIENIDDGKAGVYKVKLVGKINDCGVIKPRHSVKVEDFDQWEKRFLPARGFGALILSTPMGIMTPEEARKKNTGGVLLAYVY
jgi:small subunit ribosomal protein S8